MSHPASPPALVIADSKGKITDFPELKMAGMSTNQFLLPAPKDLIPLPPGSELFALPDRLPIGWDVASNEPALLTEYPYGQSDTVQAVAAFIAPAHTSLYNSAYQSSPDSATLPLFAYTSVGWLDGQFWVTAFRSDSDIRQDFDQYRQEDVVIATKKKLSKFKKNRLINHLGRCCLTYGCPAARNYFLGRWEAPIPTSPHCNARCIGCISLQTSGCCPATQDRISFVPTVEEIVEIAVPHLTNSANPIVSFGQGCEGEPLLQSQVIEKAIPEIRSGTKAGTINMNTNGSLPKEIRQLAKAGLDSIRVSLNSANETYYNRYYRPKNYTFEDVLQSIDIMKEHGKFVSLNYFIFPGFTDSLLEYDYLCSLIETHKPDFIQLRNLNMDPEVYAKRLNFQSDIEPIKIRLWLEQLKQEFPDLQFGYFNPQVSKSK